MVAGEEGIEPSVQIIAARCSRLSRVGRQGVTAQSNKHIYIVSKQPEATLYFVIL